jgi:pimeloyl-ACP methyl ester carboxylesterase
LDICDVANHHAERDACNGAPRFGGTASVLWLLAGFGILVSLPLSLILFFGVLHYYLRWRYLGYVIRIFQEKPLFIVPRGQPIDGEEVLLPTTHGLTLRGCYLKTKAEKRKGVILFGLEFGSNRWSCVPYCENLLRNGYDVFAFEMRGQGDSPSQPGYEPLQWLTDHEVNDCQTALKYLKERPDADPEGIGFLGISKGAAAGLMAGADDPWVRCFVTDGVFATYTTMIPYMRKWYAIYNEQSILRGLAPTWYYGWMGQVGLNRIAQQRQCRFPHLENVMPKLAPRPLLMIHGGGDTYIKPEMAQELFDRARPPKEFWLVDGAKHNQALQLAKDEYQRRVLDFFDSHLAHQQPAQTPATSLPAATSAPLIKTV